MSIFNKKLKKIFSFYFLTIFLISFLLPFNLSLAKDSTDTELSSIHISADKLIVKPNERVTINTTGLFKTYIVNAEVNNVYFSSEPMVENGFTHEHRIAEGIGGAGPTEISHSVGGIMPVTMIRKTFDHTGFVEFPVFLALP